LGQARAENRPQYLRIQAYTLIDTEQPQNAEYGDQLCDYLLVTYPDCRFESAPAWHAKADAAIVLKEYERAAECLLRAIEAERVFPSVLTNAKLDFAYLVAVAGLNQHYQLAESLLLELAIPPGGLLPAHRFRYAAAGSIFADYAGHRDAAQKAAREALSLLNARHSGLPRHPTIGLVTEAPPGLLAQLKRFAT
jgi:hypothetical protein